MNTAAIMNLSFLYWDRSAVAGNDDVSMHLVRVRHQRPFKADFCVGAVFVNPPRQRVLKSASEWKISLSLLNSRRARSRSTMLSTSTKRLAHA